MPDIEKLPETTVKTWIALVRSYERLSKKIEGNLKADGLPPLNWYDVLLELSRENVSGLRPMELEKRLLLPQYGLSRLLERLEREKLISREPAPDDRRGQIIRITSAGRDLQARIWPVYASALNAAFGNRLTASEARQLYQLLSKLGPTDDTVSSV